MGAEKGGVWDDDAKELQGDSLVIDASHQLVAMQRGGGWKVGRKTLGVSTRTAIAMVSATSALVASIDIMLDS